MADDRKQTAYRVLVPYASSTDVVDAQQEGLWREIPGTFPGSDDKAAIKTAEEAEGPFDHGAVAIPVRSWRPRTVKEETVRRRLWT